MNWSDLDLAMWDIAVITNKAVMGHMHVHKPLVYGCLPTKS